MFVLNMLFPCLGLSYNSHIIDKPFLRGDLSPEPMLDSTRDDINRITT